MVLSIACGTDNVFTDLDLPNLSYKHGRNKRMDGQTDDKAYGYKVSRVEKLSALETLLTSEVRAGRRHNYLYIHSPGGVFNVISFSRAVIL